jgi:hypothetical protein
MTDNTTLPSAIPMLRQVVEYADIEHDRKEYFAGLLTDGRFSQMSYQDAAELLEIMTKAQDKLEKSVLDTNDPDMINELTDMKKFVNETLYEAEMSALQAGAGEIDLANSDEAEKALNPQYLLDKFAGLVE